MFGKDNRFSITSTTAVFQFGQFLAHDLSFTAENEYGKAFFVKRYVSGNLTVPLAANGASISCCDANNDMMDPSLAHPACMAIPVAPDDEFYNINRTITTCMNFVRTVTGPRNNCSFGSADQVVGKDSYMLYRV